MANISAAHFYDFMKCALDFFGLAWNDKDEMLLIIRDDKIGFTYEGEEVLTPIERIK